MKVFHGSERIIEVPSFEYKNKANDYGPGFYLTEEIELAKEWACKKGKDGFVNCYDLNCQDLSICNLNSADYNILNWLALLTRYRGYWQQHSIAEEAKNYLQENFLPDISAADIIIGYRADDSYFSFAQDFVMGSISLRQLALAMKLGKLGEQLVLKSRKAFEQISFVSCESVDAKIYYQKKYNRDLAARRDYASSKSLNNIDDIYMLDILRGRIRKDDLRL